MLIKVDYLLAQGSGSNAYKFYLAVAHGAANFTINGANTPHGSGQVNQLSSASAVQTKVRQKLKEYSRVEPSRINPAAKDTLVGQIVRAMPELAGKKYEFKDDGIQFLGVGRSEEATQPKGSSRPKSTKKLVHDWF